MNHWQLAQLAGQPRRFDPRNVFATGPLALPDIAFAFDDGRQNDAGEVGADGEDPAADPASSSTTEDPPKKDPAKSNPGASAAELEAERKKREKAERELAKMREAEEKRRKAQMTDLEKAQEEAAQARKDAEDARARLASERRDRRMLEALRSAGCNRPEVAIKLVDSSAIVDDEGQLVGVEAEVERLKSTVIPELFGTKKVTTTTSGSQTTTPNDRNGERPKEPETDQEVGGSIMKSYKEGRTTKRRL